MVCLFEGASFGAVLWTHKVNYREEGEVRRNGPNEVEVDIEEFDYCDDADLES